MQGSYLHFFSLTPRSRLLAQFVADGYRPDFVFAFVSSWAFCAVGIAADVVRTICQVKDGATYSQPLSLAIAGVIMAVYYTGAWLCGRSSVRLQCWLLILSSLLHSVLMTELHVFTGEKDDLMGRALSSAPFFIALSAQAAQNFLCSSLPFALSLVYPAARLRGTG